MKCVPTLADRMALLMAVHGDSYRSVAERCGLDHTTLMRVARGETENPATLAKIAEEGYGVPVGAERDSLEGRTKRSCCSGWPLRFSQAWWKRWGADVTREEIEESASALI